MIQAIADVAHAAGIPLIVDNTARHRSLILDFGADICVTLTKMIGGHGTTVGGAIVEKGDFDWKSSGKFPTITEDDASTTVSTLGGLWPPRPSRCPGLARVLRIRTGLLRDMGAASRRKALGTSYKVWKPCPARRTPLQQCAKSRRILADHPAVSWVEYSGLPSHADNARARLSPLGPGAIFGFGLKGGYEAGKKFIDSVELCSHLANVLDAKTLVIHPASTTHQQLTPKEQTAAGVPADMVRISVAGIGRRHHRRPHPRKNPCNHVLPLFPRH